MQSRRRRRNCRWPRRSRLPPFARRLEAASLDDAPCAKGALLSILRMLRSAVAAAIWTRSHRCCCCPLTRSTTPKGRSSRRRQLDSPLEQRLSSALTILASLRCRRKSPLYSTLDLPRRASDCRRRAALSSTRCPRCRSCRRRQHLIRYLLSYLCIRAVAPRRWRRLRPQHRLSPDIA